MNKNRFTEFFKGKGYYVLLFIGVMAIAAVAVIGSQLSSKGTPEDQNYVNLNDTDNNIAANDGGNQVAENNPISDGIVNNDGNSTDSTVTNDNTNQEVASNPDGPELEGYADNSTTGTTTAQAAETTDQAKASDQSSQTAQTNEAAAVETTGSKVQDESKLADNLSFNADNGLLWPVQGNVIMNYSMNHTIYFATLRQYKCNPAVILEAQVGTQVKAAADGVVTNIDANNDETGYTITMGIGNGYSVVYGQLNKDSAKLKVGDTVKEGQAIATIAEPSKYYVVEGSNLYFQVLKNDVTVNPMLLLRSSSED